MKKLHKVLTIIAVCIICAGFNSCTQYKINIGEWFGSWHLEEMLIEGVPDENYHQNLMISFQRNLFNFAYLESMEIYGTWSIAGDILTLNASYKAGSGVNADAYFDPFPVIMHFPRGVEELEISVNYINGRTMQWQYIDEASGKLITYNFRKYP